MTDSVWHLPIPLVDGKPPLNANDRLHWAVKNRRAQDIKDAIGWRVRENNIPRLEHVAVQLVFQPQDRRRRDPSNLMPTQKAAVDGLVAAGVVVDDTPTYVEESVPAVLNPDGGPRRMWLVVEWTPEAAPEVKQWIDEDTRFERTHMDAAGGDRQ